MESLTRSRHQEDEANSRLDPKVTYDKTHTQDASETLDTQMTQDKPSLGTPNSNPFFLNTQQGDKNNLLRLSPRKPRNMKNLSLDLNPGTETEPQTPQQQSQTQLPPPPLKPFERPPPLFRSRTGSSGANSLPTRHPSLSIHNSVPGLSASGDTFRPPGLQRRRTTLLLTIPPRSGATDSFHDFGKCNDINDKANDNERNNDEKASMANKCNTVSNGNGSPKCASSTHFDDSSYTNDSSLSYTLNNLNLTNDTKADSYRVGAYKDGPACVLEPNLFLYSEPSVEQLKQFDLVINCAKELKDWSSLLENSSTQYMFVPWTHTSQLCQDFQKLVEMIDSHLKKDHKILIHCQCGVSRSASLVVAYIMKHKNLSLNDAYNEVKLKAPLISPNMTLIFQLMEWNKMLQGSSGMDSTLSTPTTEVLPGLMRPELLSPTTMSEVRN